ncbi:ATP-binding protein [Leptolyngbya sp. FACHB-671]|uniref:ATP-binding protein n=1 Tax=Leptolyngbya sp. FACHB-671 TaxID=2692812 RepID=UPI0016856011|nr:ATP-binding protein [Leptolyngbya sp. FACHB-671]MBD2068799.1 ATP-binding protein [Leptolyngbya sp. FACHB-671]
MTSIEEIIRREVNPFDPVTFKTGNFWQNNEQAELPVVESIHRDVVDQVTAVLNQISKDHQTRTIMIAGDTGSGKSYVLGRLKQTLNSKAFFSYIGPCPDNEHIWRHTLRQTVDSLMHNPEGQEESQLLLWLKSLSAFKDRSLMKKLFGEKSLFVNNLRSTYPVGIYQTKEFFSVLYALIDPSLYFIACDWLRGELLDDDDLKRLGVKEALESEAAAQGILANFGRISTSTQPIVLCFDQIESKRSPDGTADIQPIFQVNTTFHNEGLKNFLIIISIVTDVWRINRDRIPQSDKARIEKGISLKPISIEEAEELWASRLYPLHAQANPKPETSIYPLTQQHLEKKFPGGKTTPRAALALGEHLILQYKLKGNGGKEPPERDKAAYFKLLWDKEFRKTEDRVTRIRQFSSPELISMLRRVISALELQETQFKFLPSQTYASYSFCYQHPQKSQKVGVIWAEDPNMNSFFRVMDACRKVDERKLCDVLYLIRAETTGKTANRGYRLYEQVFNRPPHDHLKPDITSIHYLVTYDRLVNSVHSQELVVAGETIDLHELEMLTRKSGVLKECRLLQELKIFPSIKNGGLEKTNQKVKDSVLNFAKIHQLISRKVVAQHAKSQFSQISESEIQGLIQELCQENELWILDSNPPIEEQIICLVPPKAS